MALPDGGWLPSFRRLEWAMLGPQLRELEAITPPGWPRALIAWRQAMQVGERDRSWLRVADVQPFVDRLLSLEPDVLASISQETAWAFALAPIDASGQSLLLRAFGQAVLGRRSLRAFVDVGRLEGATLEETEAIAGQATVLRWFARRFPGAGWLTPADADALEEAAAAHARSLMDGAVVRNDFGRCVACGAECKPWFDECEPCHSGRRRSRAVTPARRLLRLPRGAQPRDHRSPRRRTT